MIPPPSEATLSEYVFSARTFPAEAVQHETASGQLIGIVPETPRYGNVTTTQYVSTCGMGCCVAPRRVTHNILVNDPTPLPALESILRLAGVTRDDVLFDLGSGDGRVCVLAAKLLGCFSVGLDKRPEAAKLGDANAKLNGVDDLAAFYAFPIAGQRLAHATVVYAYLTPETMATLRIPTNVRMGISYKHKWPGVRCEKVGEFYIWKRPSQKVTANIVKCRL